MWLVRLLWTYCASSKYEMGRVEKVQQGLRLIFLLPFQCHRLWSANFSLSRSFAVSCLSFDFTQCIFKDTLSAECRDEKNLYGKKITQRQHNHHQAAFLIFSFSYFETLFGASVIVASPWQHWSVKNFYQCIMPSEEKHYNLDKILVSNFALGELQNKLRKDW